MPEYFLHGVEVIEVDDGIRPIRSVRSSVIGLIGTAPDAEPAIAASATTGAADDNTGLTLTAKTAGLAGNAIRLVVTKPDRANARLNVTVKGGNTITVTLATGGDKAATTTAAQLKAAIEGKATAHALVAVAHTGDSDGSGVVATGEVRLAGGADAPFMADVPALVAGPRAASRLGDAGTLKHAYEAVYAQGAREAIVVRVEEGNDDATTLANVVGQAAQGTGVFALLAAASKLDLTPRILAAPGFAKTETARVAPVLANLIAVAEKLRAVVIADGPDTNETDAKLARRNYGSDRVFIVDPAVSVFDPLTATYVDRPASPYVAGLIAKRDIEKGFWWSPSNQVINGIAGTTRPVHFHLSEPQTEANRMNEAEVATIVRRSGFRLWGNRSTAADAQWAFLSVRRTADILYESMERAHLWAMDRPFSPQLVADLIDGANAFGQRLVGQGALLGFRCWLDPELNTETVLKAGKLYLNFDFEPPAPLEHLIFRAHREDNYYRELIAEVGRAA